MAPLEPWEKVMVDGEAYPETVHGHIACVDCHKGVQSPDKDTAHTNLIPNPSQDAHTYCGDCHPDVVAVALRQIAPTSLVGRRISEIGPQTQGRRTN